MYGNPVMAICPALLLVSTNNATNLSGINIKSKATTTPIMSEVASSSLRASFISRQREIP